MNVRTEKELRASFLNQPLMPFIGAKLSAISPGKAQIEVDYKKNITQQHGLFHGGVSGAIADNAAGFAAMTLMDREKEPLTIEFKINFLNIANGKSLIAEAVILQGGRSIFHGESKVYTVNEKNKILVATALVTIKATSKVSENLF
ncbi:MAG: PaaI family thioesterase [Paracoccaceae bacterium]